MVGETEDTHVVFNGEIYNHLELRRELIRVGHTFRSSCDTEVLLRAYHQWGWDWAEENPGKQRR